ncbi:MAG: lamin tail domain-containing protein [Myxococcales bacterium]|nr:lamin tail domain-containing protein [Myxococcales bacterium]MCB9717977.1 lamin tail domain-containing protein [Myxococcales bacterium]
MNDPRSRLVFALSLGLPLASGCADDIPPVPGDGGDTTGGSGATSSMTLPTGTTLPGTGDATDSLDTTAGDTASPGTTTGEPGTTTEPGTTSGTTGDGSESSGGSSTSAGTLDDTIYEIQDGTIATGSSVDVQGVIVTGVGGTGFFAQEPAGGQYSGVYVYLNAAPTVVVGDEVDITGVTEEFNDLTELNAELGSVTPTGVTGVVLTPDLVSGADLSAAAGEPWEGVYVRIEGAPLAVVGLPGFSEFDVNDGGADDTRIDNFLYSVFDFPALYPLFGVGASFTAIQGPVNFTFGDYKVCPRQDADLEGYMGGPPPMGASVDDLVPGDLVVTEVMFDPNCTNDDCEWIEIYNDSGMDVSLLGLRIQDSNFSVATQGTINVDVLLPAGGYGVLGSDDAMVWPYAMPALAHYGPNPAFNNTGDLVALLNSTEILDQTATYPTFGTSDNGISWKLDPTMTTAVANDVAANWCFSTVVFDSPGGVDEYGSPGAANEAACAMLP